MEISESETNTKFKSSSTAAGTFRLSRAFRHSSLFRIPDFGIRISARRSDWFSHPAKNHPPGTVLHHVRHHELDF
jgi:hypothetical protein